MNPVRGDVVRSSDPFKTGTDVQRPWLIVNTQEHPFADEQFIAVAISTSQYDQSIRITEDAWEIGGVPEDSFLSPWSIHSPRIEDLIAWQGRLTEDFLDRTAAEIRRYV